MSDEHTIHRLHAFLPHLAERIPELLDLLPAEERPEFGIPLAEWAWTLPQRRLMEICSTWVLEAMTRLKDRSPLTNVLMRGCLFYTGEFDIADAAAAAIGEVPRPDDPRREELRRALAQAVRLGILIHVPSSDRFCVPFPVRLSFEGVDFHDPLESETIKLRIVWHFAALCSELASEPDLVTPKYWRFANMLTAYEFAVDLAEDFLGIESVSWLGTAEVAVGLPETMRHALVRFARCMGRALVMMRSGTGERLLEASAAAARRPVASIEEAECYGMLGQYHLRRGNLGQAIEVWQRSNGLRAELADHAGVIIGLSAIALAHRELGSPELAIQDFVGAARYARDAGLVESELDTANCAVNLLIAERRPFEAAELAESTLSHLKELGHLHPAYAELLVNAAIAMRAEGRAEDALQCLYSALGLSRSWPHRPIEAMACQELGTSHDRAGESEKALKWFRRARSLFVEIGDYGGLANCLLSMARVLRHMENESASEELLGKATRAAQTAKLHDVEATIWRERSIMAEQAGDRGAAISHAHQEINALRNVRAAEPLVRAHLRVATLLAHDESWSNAARHALRAQGIARAFLRGYEGSVRDSSPDETSDRSNPRPALERLIARLAGYLSAEQFEALVEEVSEELEQGELKVE